MKTTMSSRCLYTFRTTTKSFAVNCAAIIFLGIICRNVAGGVEISSSEHRTKAALEKANDLWCHRCDTMEDGERCVDLRDNSTTYHAKCDNEQRICIVKRISMSASSENVTGVPKLWLLQRNCTRHCEPGCIVIGERTKLHACTTCCENKFCNTGSSATICSMHQVTHGTAYTLLLFLLYRINAVRLVQ